jgi:hypothetical protein
VKIFLETLHKIGKEKAKETANLNISLSWMPTETEVLHDRNFFRLGASQKKKRRKRMKLLPD